MTSGTALSREAFEALDRDDPLARFRAEFDLPDLVYLDGNSLGPPSKAVKRRMRAVVDDQWGSDLIRGWLKHDWIELPGTVGDKIARIVGAEPGEVTVADSTSVNLFKLAVPAVQAQQRPKIVSELGNFPTDLYILQGIERLLGKRARLVAVPREEILAQLDDDTALVVLTHTHYKTAEIFDMQAVNDAAHACGAMTLWDLSHTVGVRRLQLTASGADLAVGTTYKYMNGGPGSPAFLYVAKRHQNTLQQPIAGWMGHRAPFDFVDDYAPIDGIKRNLSGTPMIISLSALDAAVDVLLEAGIDLVQQKSESMTELFIQLVEQVCGSYGFELASPRQVKRRGGHVSLRHADGYAIIRAMDAAGVVGDFRMPDILRFGFSPLYQRYADIWTAVETLHSVMDAEAWRAAAYQQRAAVT